MTKEETLVAKLFSVFKPGMKIGVVMDNLEKVDWVLSQVRTRFPNVDTKVLQKKTFAAITFRLPGPHLLTDDSARTN